MMKRRDFLGAGAAMAVAAALRAAPAATFAPSWARPSMPGWPGADEWAALNRAVGGRLSPVTLPDFADPAVRELLADPFYIGGQAGLTQSTGWLDAWRSVPSAHEEARSAWQPLIDFATANSADYEGQDALRAAALPARQYWDADFHRRYGPAAVVFDSQPGASSTDFWWPDDAG
jgi:hypothetical protein